MLSVAQSFGARFKRGSNGDMVSACPAGCAKRDGFIVNPSKGVFLCRPSGAAGDIIQMVEHLRGCSRVEAAEFLAGAERPGANGAPANDEAKAEVAAKRAQQQAANARRSATQARLDEFKLIRDGEAVASIMERAEPFHGSPAAAYLQERGAGLPRGMTRDLRFVESLHFWGFADAQTEDASLLATLPAMVGLIKAIDGALVGLHLTYLDPDGPRKWVAPWERALPKELRRNPAKKFRKAAHRLNGAMIRLGAIGDTLVIGEGIETVGAYFARGFAVDDATFGVATSLQNLSGGSVAQIDHPTKRQPNGKASSIPNGIPDPLKPGVLLPAHVKRVFLLGDGDSDAVATRAALLAAFRRYRGEGREVFVHMAPMGEDFASMKLGAVP